MFSCLLISISHRFSLDVSIILSHKRAKISCVERVCVGFLAQKRAENLSNVEHKI